MFYESRLRYGGYGMMEYGPRMMHFQNISPSESWDGWEQENDRYWQDFDRRMGSMMERNNRMFRDVDTVPVPQNLNGKYSGTKIINGDSFTYSLEVGADSLT